jgi:CubicO group peptidase (beta-lactamase class C family)
MLHRIAPYWLATIFFCFAPAGTRAQTCSDQRLSRPREYISRLIRNDSIPSIAIGVAYNGRLVCAEGFGYADKAERTPATGHTRYAVASVAKPFVATGIMLLVERGQVVLDSSANEYLPRRARLSGHAAEASQVTIRHLLQHRAGLPSPHVTRFLPAQAPSAADAVRRYGIVVNPPDERYAYSNLGYGVLALLSSEVTGKRYDRFLHEAVFQPLGLRQTSLEIGPRLSRPAARLYGDDNRVLPYYLFDEWGSGRIWSSAHDLIAFGLSQLGISSASGRTILADSSRARMVQDRRPTGSATGRYGLDWFYGLGWGGRDSSRFSPLWYGHDGGMPGASADLKLLPQRGMVVVALANSDRAPTRALTDSIVHALVPEYAAMRREDPVLTREAQEPKPFTPPGELIGEWRGRIVTWNGDVPLRISISGDSSLWVGLGKRPLTRAGEVEYQEDRLTFDADARLGTPDLSRFPEHTLWFSLTLRGDSLSGAVTAYTPTHRVPSVALPSWVVVHRPLQ